jgi:hypothetical protein
MDKKAQANSNQFRPVLGHIRAYEGDDGTIYLYSQGRMLTKLPSGNIFNTSVQAVDWKFFESRMHLIYIGELYEAFTPDNYDSLVERVREIYRSARHNFPD